MSFPSGFSRQRGIFRSLIKGHFQISLIIFAVHVVVLDRQPCVPKWRMRLRWLLDFSSKKTKKKKRGMSLQLPCSSSFPLPPPPHSSSRLRLWGRWLREKQVIITEHSENNQWSRKWAINIKIPSSDAPRKWDSRSKAMLNNTQVGRTCARVCVCLPKKCSLLLLFSWWGHFSLDSHFLPHGPYFSLKVFFFLQKLHP